MKGNKIFISIHYTNIDTEEVFNIFSGSIRKHFTNFNL